MYEYKTKNALYKISSYEEHMAEISFEKNGSLKSRVEQMII